MATSGTWNFTLDLTDILEDAYELAGSQLRGGFDYERGRRCIDLLMLEWQNEETNLFTLKSDTQLLVAGSGSYQLDAERINVVDVALRTDSGDSDNQTDTYLRRMSASEYAHQSKKLQQGKPLKYWLQRSPDGLTINLWPVPDATTTYYIYYHYLERIEDSGAPGTNNMDVEARYLPALVHGVALNLARRIPEGLPRLPDLQSAYDTAWDKATDAARERASFRVRPGGYR